MSQSEEPIEAYLDDLLARLTGRPGEVRRALREAEDHLYSDAEAAVAAGAERHHAETQAVARFGDAASVAASFDLERRGAAVRDLIEQVVALAGLGLVAIGLSGLVERAMTAIWGKVWVFADAPGTHYSASSCRYWESLHPHAAGCTQAYLAEAMSDGLVQRFGVGVIGVLVLLAVASVMRRRGRSIRAAVTSPAAVVLGGAAFLVAAVVFLAVGADRYAAANGNGAGQWFSAVAVSLPFAAAFGLSVLRRVRRVGLPVW